MSSRVLVIILGHNYCHPMIITGDINILIGHLAFESKDNTYLYCLFTLTEKYYYIPRGVIHKGRYDENSDMRIDGIRIKR